MVRYSLKLSLPLNIERKKERERKNRPSKTQKELHLFLSLSRMFVLRYGLGYDTESVKVSAHSSINQRNQKGNQKEMKRDENLSFSLPLSLSLSLSFDNNATVVHYDAIVEERRRRLYNWFQCKQWDSGRKVNRGRKRSVFTVGVSVSIDNDCACRLMGSV